MKDPSPQETETETSNLTRKKKTLTKLTLTTVAAVTFGASTLLAGPGPIGPTNRPGRNLPPVKTELTCQSMVVNHNPRLGGVTFVKCTKAIKDTLECRRACA